MSGNAVIETLYELLEELLSALEQHAANVAELKDPRDDARRHKNTIARRRLAAVKIRTGKRLLS